MSTKITKFATALMLVLQFAMPANDFAWREERDAILNENSQAWVSNK